MRNRIRRLSWAEYEVTAARSLTRLPFCEAEGTRRAAEGMGARFVSMEGLVDDAQHAADQESALCAS